MISGEYDITVQQFNILRLLDKQGEMYGKQVADVSGITEKSVYTTLGRMENRKLVTSQKEVITTDSRTSSALRRFYRITNKGKKSIEHFIREINMEVQIAK